MKTIGPTFPEELFAANLGGLPFAWGPDGVFVFDPLMTPQQIAAVEAVYASHNPLKPVVVVDHLAAAREAVEKIPPSLVRSAMEELLKLL